MPALPVIRSRTGRMLGRVSLAAFVAASLVPSAAAAYGDKPKIPNEKVLKVYDQTLAKEKVAAIAPVSTGLAALTQNYGARSFQDPRLNPDMYRGTIEILRKYIQVIAANGPRKDVVPLVELQRDDRVNAAATSQETIVLTTGLVDKITSNIRDKDANFQQMLFTLAHEYAHILYDHPRRFAQKAKPVGIAKLLGTALVVAAVVNDVSAKGGDGAAIDPKTMGALQFAFALSPLIEMEIRRASYAPYKKNQESLADFMAVDLMDAVGYGDPGQACTWMLDLEKYDNSLKAQLNAGLKRMGTNFNASMTQLSTQAPGLLIDGGPKAVLEQAKANLLKVILAAAGDFIARRFNPDRIHLHYSAEKRVDAIKAYANKFFPPKEEQAEAATVSAWANKNKVPDPGRLADTFERENGPDKAASAAKLRLIENDIPGARRILDEAKARFATLSRGTPPPPAPAKPAPKATPKGKGGKGGKGAKPAAAPAAASARAAPVIPSSYFHIIDGQTYMAAGQIEEAAKALNLATRQPVAPLSAFQMLASAYGVLGKSAAVIETLNRAAALFGEEQVILLRIRHFVATSDRPKAEALVQQCAQYPALAKRCQEALPLIDKNDDKDDEDSGEKASDDGKGKPKARPKKGGTDDDDDEDE